MIKVKRIFLVLVLLFTIFFSFNTTVFANPDNKVYLGGENIGIKVNTMVTVVGKYEVDTKNGKEKPWKDSNILVNDKIIKVNGKDVYSNEDVYSVLNKSNKKVVDLTLLRDDLVINTKVSVIKNIDNQLSLGLLIKDSVLGIGTLTFIDSKTKNFASLGHGIYNDKELYEDVKGVITNTYVNSIKKSIPGNAGEIRSKINNNIIGFVNDNDETGLYGKYTSGVDNKKIIEVADVDEVQLGPAKILTMLDDNKVGVYDVEIIGLEKQNIKDIKGIRIKIKDTNLLEKTGGIVQGMSGSPIIQNNMLVGAVSHVTIDNPSVGFGMYAQWMFMDAIK